MPKASPGAGAMRFCLTARSIAMRPNWLQMSGHAWFSAATRVLGEHSIVNSPFCCRALKRTMPVSDAEALDVAAQTA